MLEEELVQLVNKITYEKCENQHIEFKKALGGTPTKLYICRYLKWPEMVPGTVKGAIDKATVSSLKWKFFCKTRI